MKRLIAILLTLTLLLSLSACGNTSAETKPADTKPTETTAETKTETPAETTKKTKLDTVKESGKLIVGTTADYPPYEFHAMIDGKDTIVGFDMALAADIAKHLGVELEIQDMEFSAVLSGVETGLIDVGIAGIKSTAERDKTMDFSKIYRNSKNNYTILTRIENETLFNSPEDLKGDYIVGAQMGTIQEEYARALYAEDKLLIIPKITDLVLNLNAKMVDGLVVEKSVAELYANQNEGLISLGDKFTFEIGDDEGGSVVVAKEGEKELLDEINIVIDELLSSGKLEEYYVEAVALSEAQNQ